MIALNLIPPSYRDQYRLQQTYTMFRYLIAGVILYTIFLAIILLVARMVLQRHFDDIVAQTSLVTIENREVEHRISALNREIEQAQALTNVRTPWVALLVNLSNLAPADITISSMRFTTGKNDRSIITGTAKTRDALISFEESLKATPYFTNVDLPRASLIQRENASFTISLTVDLTKVPTPL